MSDLIIKLFLKNADKDREKYGFVSGFSCIICNAILFISKFIIGTITGSVSITADAFNNLSDSLSNIFTIAGAKIASKPNDKEHPFGHGRMEYISAMIMSVFIFTMGIELGKSSIEKIIHPTDVKFSITSIIVLIIAICIKLWMAVFNNKLYKLSNNLNMKAVTQDSLNDCIATSATILALIISSFTKFKRFDGIIGTIVAIVILISGVKIVAEVISTLLGKAPDDSTVQEVKKIILSKQNITGVHDLIIHDYGPKKIFASAHAEVPPNSNIVEIHEEIDNAEKEIREKLGIDITIHTDPIDEHNHL
jgi:cation diffusion facilitator family transporter